MAEKSVHIRYLAAVDEANTRKLMDTVEQKLKEGATRFVLLLSSHGGNVFYGLSAYNYLKGIPAEVVTHNFGSVISMGIVLFCAGSKRLSVPHGTFLLHGVQANFQKGTNLQEDQLEERLKGLRLDMENIAGVIAATTGKSEQDVLRAILERTTLNPEQAVEYGLVTEIREQLFDKGIELISIQ
ncbi:ClpP family protease [Chloroflexota bacterium]